MWTPDQITRSAEDTDIQPVGRGSANDALGGDQAWAGSFNTPGTYYVVISPSAAAPASYLLQVNQQHNAIQHSNGFQWAFVCLLEPVRVFGEESKPTFYLFFMESLHTYVML